MTVILLNSSTTTFFEACNLVITLDHIASSKKFVQLKYQLIGLMQQQKSIFLNMGEAFVLDAGHKLFINQIINETTIELTILKS